MILTTPLGIGVSDPANADPADPGVLVPREGDTSSTVHSRSCINFKLRLPPSHFELLMPRNKQAKKEITILVRERTVAMSSGGGGG